MSGALQKARPSPRGVVVASLCLGTLVLGGCAAGLSKEPAAPHAPQARQAPPAPPAQHAPPAPHAAAAPEQRLAPAAPAAGDGATPAAKTAAKTAAPAKPPPAVQFRDALALIELWLGAQQQYDRLPSLTAAVVVGDETLWRGAWGTVDAAGRVPATPDTLYSICSISKLFTSVAAMQLWEDRRLLLDDDIVRWLPEAARLGRADADSAPVTVRGLLTHSAGVPQEAALSYWLEQSFPDRGALLDALARQKNPYRAADRFAYSNLGMTLLGEVVASAAGEPYEAFVQRRLLAPLEMRSTVPSLGRGFAPERMATGFSAIGRDGKRTPLAGFDTRALVPAAGYSSTVEDLARFARWQLRLLEKGGSELLKVATLRDMHRVQWTNDDGKLTWGLGFVSYRDGPSAVVGHGGQCPGYRSELALMPKERLAVTTLTNTYGPLGDAGETLYTAGLRHILAKAQALEPPEAGDATPWDDYVGAYRFIGEDRIIRWGRHLALVRLPTADPTRGLLRLKPDGRDRFIPLDDDGREGEPFYFERDAQGVVTHLRLWNQRAPRVR